MTSQEELIRAQLGPNMKQRTFRLGDADWVAWCAPLPCNQLPKIVKDRMSTRAYYDAWAADVKAVAAETTLRAANIRYFVGMEEGLRWAIPGLPALDVIELAKVGTYNEEPDDWRGVRDFISSVFTGFAFDVVFADIASLDLMFITPISAEVARKVDKAWLDELERTNRLIRSYTYMIDCAGDLHLAPDADADPRGGGQVPAFITTTQSLRLHWK